MSNKDHITTGNVFEDLGFDKVESKNLKLRAELMLAVCEQIKHRKLTQAKAAKLFGVDQPRISKLLQGKIELFTIDRLVEMLSNAGVSVSLKIAA